MRSARLNAGNILELSVGVFCNVGHTLSHSAAGAAVVCVCSAGDYGAASYTNLPDLTINFSHCKITPGLFLHTVI